MKTNYTRGMLVNFIQRDKEIINLKRKKIYVYKLYLASCHLQDE